MVKIFCIHIRCENVDNLIGYCICTVILKYHKTFKHIR